MQHVSSVKHSHWIKDIVVARCNMYYVYDTVPGTKTWWRQDETRFKCKIQSQEQRHAGGIMQHVSSVKHSHWIKDMVGGVNNKYPV